MDLRLGLDLVTHARNRFIDQIYLVSGDDDLTEAAEEAQGHGVQVVVMAVPNGDSQPHAVSRHLLREADGMIRTNSTWLLGAFAAVGATFATGLSLGAIGDLGSDHPVRLTFAIVGIVLFVSAIVVAITKAAEVSSESMVGLTSLNNDSS